VLTRLPTGKARLLYKQNTPVGTYSHWGIFYGKIIIMKTYGAKIISKKEVARDVLEIRLNKPDGFVFLAGQFVQVYAPDLTKNGSLIKRAYSISSAPVDPFIELCVKVLPGGKASGYLNTLPVGGEVMFEGPFGHFVSENSAAPLLFVATGTGLAPLISILKDELLIKKSKRSIELLFGVRSQDVLFWVDALEELKKSAPSFSYTITLSQPAPGWKGTEGRVTSHLPATVPERLVFICGALAMVKDVRALLQEKGVQQKNIRVEIF
jgi:benzoate/toluate 1,2-dioxygenase reductase subunit